MCECIKEVQKSVASANDYNAVELDCIVTNTKTNEKITGQRIDVCYNHILRNGGIKRKYKKSFISHVFCPFCGVKYN